MKLVNLTTSAASAIINTTQRVVASATTATGTVATTTLPPVTTEREGPYYICRPCEANTGKPTLSPYIVNNTGPYTPFIVGGLLLFLIFVHVCMFVVYRQFTRIRHAMPKERPTLNALMSNLAPRVPVTEDTSTMETPTFMRA